MPGVESRDEANLIGLALLTLRHFLLRHRNVLPAIYRAKAFEVEDRDTLPDAKSDGIGILYAMIQVM